MYAFFIILSRFSGKVTHEVYFNQKLFPERIKLCSKVWLKTEAHSNDCIFKSMSEYVPITSTHQWSFLKPTLCVIFPLQKFQKFTTPTFSVHEFHATFSPTKISSRIVSASRMESFQLVSIRRDRALPRILLHWIKSFDCWQPTK